MRTYIHESMELKANLTVPLWRMPGTDRRNMSTFYMKQLIQQNGIWASDWSNAWFRPRKTPETSPERDYMCLLFSKFEGVSRFYPMLLNREQWATAVSFKRAQSRYVSLPSAFSGPVPICVELTWKVLIFRAWTSFKGWSVITHDISFYFSVGTVI